MGLWRRCWPVETGCAAALVLLVDDALQGGLVLARTAAVARLGVKDALWLGLADTLASVGLDRGHL